MDSLRSGPFGSLFRPGSLSLVRAVLIITGSNDVCTFQLCGASTESDPNQHVSPDYTEGAELVLDVARKEAEGTECPPRRVPPPILSSTLKP